MNKFYRIMGVLELRHLSKIKEDKLKFLVMNLIGYRLFLIDPEFYRELCFDDQEFIETFRSRQWVFDPKMPKGVYRDTAGKAEFLCNEFKENYNE